MRKSIKIIAVIFAAVTLTALSGCAKDYGSNMEPRAEVNRIEVPDTIKNS